MCPQLYHQLCHTYECVRCEECETNMTMIIYSHFGTSWIETNLLECVRSNFFESRFLAIQYSLFVLNIEEVYFEDQREWNCFVHFSHKITRFQSKLLKIGRNVDYGMRSQIRLYKTITFFITATTVVGNRKNDQNNPNAIKQPEIMAYFL